jgi:hypothetical protein
MQDRPSGADRLEPIEGADDGALGVTPPPEPASPDAQEAVDQQLVPGATYGDRIPTEEKPWFTSLAAESEQAGVANEAADAQEPEYPDPHDEEH